MSKSKLKPEDIFFGLQKTIASDDANAESGFPAKDEHVVSQPKAEKDAIPVVKAAAEKQHREQSQSTEKKKRGPAPNPENMRRVPVNVQVAPETKYTMKSLINEMKLHGYVDRYSMTDFVAEAIEEKIDREKKRFGIE